MTDQTVTINVHDPRVKNVGRFDDGKLLVQLGNSSMQAQVDLFVTDDDWDAIVAEVARRRIDAELVGGKK